MGKIRIAVGLVTLVTACGGVSAEHRHSPKSNDEDAGRAGPEQDAAPVGSGASGGSTGTSGAGGAANGSGGTGGANPGNTGATTSTGAVTGSGGVAEAGGMHGASDGGAAPQTGGARGSNPEADAGSPLTDPRAQERRSLAEEYCAACKTDPGSGLSEANCAQGLNVDWYSWIPDSCYDELADSLHCSAKMGCSPYSGGSPSMGACLAERTSLDACIRGASINGKVTGTSGSCSWDRQASGTACSVSCVDDPHRVYSADCSGPPDGPFSCWCTLNGRTLYDELVLNGPRFYSDTCSGAARQMADGLCQKYVSCCYAYRGVWAEGDPEEDICACTSDPGASKFASCEALAASMKEGKVVDLCPKYAVSPF